MGTGPSEGGDTLRMEGRGVDCAGDSCRGSEFRDRQAGPCT